MLLRAFPQVSRIDDAPRIVRRRFGALSQPLALAALLFLCAGCGTVRLVSDYDEQIDHGITDFQRRMEKHLVALERGLAAGTGGVARHAAFYDDVTVDLTVLRLRAEQAPRNEITIQQIGLLLRNVKLLEEMHREGLAANDFPALRTAFNTACTAIIKFELAKRRGETPSS